MQQPTKNAAADAATKPSDHRVLLATSTHTHTHTHMHSEESHTRTLLQAPQIAAKCIFHKTKREPGAGSLAKAKAPRDAISSGYLFCVWKKSRYEEK